eukprot:2655337-Pleurochrysis_carterae.AAC.1
MRAAAHGGRRRPPAAATALWVTNPPAYGVHSACQTCQGRTGRAACGGVGESTSHVLSAAKTVDHDTRSRSPAEQWV